MRRPDGPVLPIGAAIIVFGALCRVLNPGLGSLWRDEALFVFVMRLPSVSQLLHFLHYSESHPPLFYLVMRAWTALLGPSEIALKSFPVVCSILLIPAVLAVGRRSFSPAAGLVAAFLTAAAPLLARDSVQLRPYSLLTLFALGSTYALVRGLNGAARWWVGYAALTAAMLWTHNWAFVYLSAQGLLVLLCAVRADLRPPADRLRNLAIAWAVIALLYAPWLPVLLFQTAHAGHPVRPIGLLDPLKQLLWWCVGLPASVSAVVYGGLLVSGFRGIRGEGSGHLGQGDRARALILIGLLPVTAILIAQIVSIRSDLIIVHCIVTLTPFVMIGCAVGLVELFRQKHWLLAYGYAFTLLAVLVLTWVWLLPKGKSNAAAVAGEVAARAHPSDLIIVAPGWLSPSFNYYFPARARQIDYPALHRVETTSYTDAYERMADPRTLQAVKDTLQAARAGGARVWLIMNAGEIADSLALRPVLSKEQAGFSAGQIRANQLRLYLIGLYGQPALAIPEHRPTELEPLRAMLFQPAPPSAVTP